MQSNINNLINPFEDSKADWNPIITTTSGSGVSYIELEFERTGGGIVVDLNKFKSTGLPITNALNWDLFPVRNTTKE